MASTYIEAIFLDARLTWKYNRLRSFQAIINELNKKETKHAQQWVALRKQNPGIEFAATEAFKLLLANLATEHKNSLSRRLQWEHALPWSFDVYYQKIETLRDYRHFLEHFEKKEKQGKLPDDAEMLRILGLLLLPHLQNHLIGRIIHHQRRVRNTSPSPLKGLLQNSADMILSC